MPDTGANQTIVSAAVARDAKLLIRPTHTELRNTSGTGMDLLGEAVSVMTNILLRPQCLLLETLIIQP